ncbi:hypothetical protein HMPREF0239_01150 [Clostridium sp. ATCC BAA-442]|nr:hypothetical protein HMPREF0372_03947 [Flavonifractor plautii ATCC 29863]ERI78617.1 hypothetical protein HMPREF0239_01150 [Clostridium sp. ATCC BAA-442]
MDASFLSVGKCKRTPAGAGAEWIPFVLLLYSILPQITREKSFKKVGGDTCILHRKRVHWKHTAQSVNAEGGFLSMKKLFGALVKLFSLLAVLGALLYAAVLYWDKIMAVVAKLRGMLPGLSTAAVDDSEAEDYADWEM